MDQEVAEKNDLADRLIAALRKDEFALFRQAIMPLAPTGGDRPFQEILIRFEEEETKLLPPGTFLPLLDEYALMPLLDRWVVSRIAKWVHARRGISPNWEVPRNCINLSWQTLYDLTFAEFTRKRIREAGLPEKTLCFEILWCDAVEHAESLLRLARQLRPAGCCFTIARFEGVPGSFQLLKTLGPDFVKMSPRVVRNIDQDPASAATAEAIRRNCSMLGIATIAEHVEGAQVLARLKRIGVDYAQGFGILPPQPLA